MQFLNINKLPKENLETMGFTWHTDADGSPYVDDKLIVISEKEANNYYEACNELYDMFANAGEYAISNNLLDKLGIPFNLHEIVKMSWENDVHWHLYGRFDLAGGLDNLPIKLLEFNANTPTALFETAILQFEQLRLNNLNEENQFNHTYEAIVDNFKRLATLDEDVSNFDGIYEGWKILFTSVKDAEEELTTRLLMQMAKDAGYECEFAYIEDVEFSEDGVFLGDINYEFCFMLIPWEIIAIEESELAHLLTKIIKNQKAIILNPAYTLMFQSKAILELLWQLYPNHKYLLKTSFVPLENTKQVKKPFFGREGANITIFDKNGEIITKSNGEYENNGYIYQEFAELNHYNEEFYQAGVFFAYEACGLGFRKGNAILDNYAKFVGHIIK